MESFDITFKVIYSIISSGQIFQFSGMKNMGENKNIFFRVVPFAVSIPDYLSLLTCSILLFFLHGSKNKGAGPGFFVHVPVRLMDGTS